MCPRIASAEPASEQQETKLQKPGVVYGLRCLKLTPLSWLLAWAKSRQPESCCSSDEKRCLKNEIGCVILWVCRCGCQVGGQENPWAIGASLTCLLLLCSAFFLQPLAICGWSRRVSAEEGNGKYFPCGHYLYMLQLASQPTAFLFNPISQLAQAEH